MPQHILEACDARAMPFGAYDQEIAASVEALTDMGVFTTAEFSDVKIGFCDLRTADGPAATTSCTRDIILLDSGYAKGDQSLVRNATLAHEMKHVLQHHAQIETYGESYCSSAQYRADKKWMEAEADAFGDGVAKLFFEGRFVEIRNECANAASVYLEADNPIAASDDPPAFMDIPAHSAMRAQERAASKFFKLYAETKSAPAEKQRWGGPAMAYKRFIGGISYGLQQVTLSNSERSTGPFYLTLACSVLE
ncbi:MAG: hypothetical protein AAFX54_09335 [Pseudomonadota bacterium]